MRCITIHFYEVNCWNILLFHVADAVLHLINNHFIF